MAQSRRSSSRSTRTPAKGLPTKSSKSVTFDLETEQELLSSIESFIAASSFTSFSDFCKHAAMQYIDHSQRSSEWAEASESGGDLGDLRQQLAALAAQLQALAGEGSRLSQVESDLAELTSRVNQLTEQAEQDGSRPSQGGHHQLPADPLLARLGSLIEDF